uniref:Plakophilin 1b n=1 Tax=Astyanax mexicanus TaxID=7994 RepID=A0A8B9HEK1_ASTMX
MTLEPLRSALSIGEVGETSLALPSDRSARSAQQRVLEQVSTMKRSKSKYSSGGGAGGGKAGGTGNLSPTSHFVQRTISTRTSSSQKNLSNSMFPSSPTAMSHSRGGQEGFTAFRSLEMSSPPAVSGGNARWSQTFRQTNRQTVERKHSQGALNSNSQIIGNGFGNGIGSVQMTGNGFGSGQVIGSSQMVGNGQVVGNGQMFGNGQVIGNGTIHRNSSGSNHQITTSQIISRRPPSTHSNPEGVKASSVENCVCILHNLTYQLESESPAIFSKMNALAGYTNRRANTTDTGPIGCFSSQSRKIQQENHFDYPVMEDNNPKGQSWLIHSQALQSYLSLLGSSQREATQEACCGALHNLTANKGIVSDVLSQTIVQKLNGLQYISPLLQSSNPELKNSVTSLLGNLSRTPRLQSMMARQALPQLVRTLNSQGADLSPESDSSIATACHTVNNLLRAEPEMSKQLLSNTLINSLNDISQNIALPKASKASGVLLHSLWSDKNIQSFLKKVRS